VNKRASTQWQQGQKDDPGPSHHGRTAQIHPDPEHPLGFRVNDLPLPPAADGDVEAALATHAPLAVADLRAARPSIGDAESFQRMRMGATSSTSRSSTPVPEVNSSRRPILSPPL
jgi:hypothetical protein